MRELLLNNGHELKKHVGTIQSSNPLSLVQRKISNALLFKAYPLLDKQDEHQIDIKSLCQIIGYDSNDHQLIKSALKKLLTTVIEWNLLHNDDNHIWNASSMLASVSISGSVCTYSYSSHMRKLLYTPKMYGRVNMLTQAKFKSSYGLALYENCVRYQNLEYSGWLAIDVFRKLMGVAPDKYPFFRDFKRRIIDRAVDEVNTHSDLLVTPEMKKVNRKIISIRFRIQHKSKSQHIDNTSSILDLLINDWEISPDKSEAVIKKYGENYIYSQIEDVVKSNNYINNNIRCKSAYLLQILSTNYKTINYQPSTRYKDYVHADYISEQISSVVSFEEIYSLVKQDDNYPVIIANFEKYLCEHHKNLLWIYYQRDKLLHPATKSIFVQYIQENYGFLINKIG